MKGFYNFCFKVIYMPHFEISVLKAEIQQMCGITDQCTDIIKNLADFPPTQPITFLIKSKDIALAELTVTEHGAGNFIVSFFMSWHAYYTKQIEHKRLVLAALEAQYNVAC